MSIERLRALENRLRDEAGQHEINALEADSVGATEAAVGQEWRPDLKRELADELASLIAELGQEVGAVEPVGYMDPDADFMLPRKGQCVLSSQVVLVRDPHGKYTRPIYLSPAHTSEARDALMAWAVKNDVAAGECDPNRRVIPLAALNQYAAMRQEGGNE